MAKNFKLKYIFIIALIISGIIFAITSRSKEQVEFEWEYNSEPVASNIIVDNNQVYYVSQNGNINVLKDSDGSLVWETQTFKPLTYTRLQVLGNRLVIDALEPGNIHKLVIFDKDKGIELFNEVIDNYSFLNEAYYADGFIYFASKNEKKQINKLDLSNMEVTQILESENEILFPKFSKDHLVYFEKIEDSINLNMLHLEEEEALEVVETQTETDTLSETVPETETVTLISLDKNILSNSILIENMLYFALEDGSVYGVDIEGNKKEWRNSLNIEVSAVYFINEVLFIASKEPKLYAIDPESGDVLIDNLLGSDIPPESLIFYVKNNTLITTAENSLQAIDLGTGYELFSYSIKDIHTKKIAIESNFLYMGTDEGLEKYELR